MDEQNTEEPTLAPGALTKGEHQVPSADVPILRDGLAIFPQPTSDPLDPLNWTSFRKHTILAVVCFKYFLFTYITTTT